MTKFGLVAGNLVKLLNFAPGFADTPFYISKKPSNIRNVLCKIYRTGSCVFIEPRIFRIDKNWFGNWGSSKTSRGFLLTPLIAPYISTIRTSKFNKRKKPFIYLQYEPQNSRNVKYTLYRTSRTDFCGSTESKIEKIGLELG